MCKQLYTVSVVSLLSHEKDPVNHSSEIVDNEPNLGYDFEDLLPEKVVITTSASKPKRVKLIKESLTRSFSPSKKLSARH